MLWVDLNILTAALTVGESAGAIECAGSFFTAITSSTFLVAVPTVGMIILGIATRTIAILQAYPTYICTRSTGTDLSLWAGVTTFATMLDVTLNVLAGLSTIIQPRGTVQLTGPKGTSFSSLTLDSTGPAVTSIGGKIDTLACTVGLPRLAYHDTCTRIAELVWTTCNPTSPTMLWV